MGVKVFGKYTSAKRDIVAVIANDAFSQADILQKRIVDLESAMKSADMEIDYEAARMMGKVKQGCNWMVKQLSYFDEEFNEGFGDYTDCLDVAIKVLRSRCGNNLYTMYKFVQYMMGFPERMPVGDLDKMIESNYGHLFKSKHEKG